MSPGLAQCSIFMKYCTVVQYQYGYPTVSTAVSPGLAQCGIFLDGLLFTGLCLSGRGRPGDSWSSMTAVWRFPVVVRGLNENQHSQTRTHRVILNAKIDQCYRFELLSERTVWRNYFQFYDVQINLFINILKYIEHKIDTDTIFFSMGLTHQGEEEAE